MTKPDWASRINVGYEYRALKGAHKNLPPNLIVKAVDWETMLVVYKRTDDTSKMYQMRLERLYEYYEPVPAAATGQPS